MGNCWSCTACKLNSGPTAAPAPPSAAAAAETIPEPDPVASSIGDVVDGNKSYTAKISDFGFAKWGPAPGNSFVTGHVVGTMGYTAPEYLAAGKLYVNSDVYSFGVVLLEMLTGLKAIDTKRPYGQDNLVQWWVKPYTSQKAKLRRMMDYRLEGKYSPKEALEIALLADRCLNWDPKLRPSTKEVAETLEKIETRYRTDNEQ